VGPGTVVGTVTGDVVVKIEVTSYGTLSVSVIVTGTSMMVDIHEVMVSEIVVEYHDVMYDVEVVVI
jgi:hypothetical protein